MSNRYDILTSLCRDEKEFLITVRRYLHTHPELRDRRKYDLGGIVKL